MNSNTDVTRMDPPFTTTIFCPAKSHESATVIGSAPLVVANPVDITSYYRAMYDERKKAGGWLREGWSAGSFEQKGCLSCAKREACIRRLCSTVVYDYLLTAVFLVSPPFVSRISDRRVSTYGDLGCSLSGLLGCLRNPPCPHSALFSKRCIEERQRRVFTSLRSHNSGRQTGKPFFLSLSLLLLLLPFRFPQVLLSSTFLAISVKYFKDRLPIVHPLARRLRFWGWVRERERLDLAAISLSATLPRLDCRDTSIVVQYRSFRLLCTLEIDYFIRERFCHLFFSRKINY